MWAIPVVVVLLAAVTWSAITRNKADRQIAEAQKRVLEAIKRGGRVRDIDLLETAGIGSDVPLCFALPKLDAILSGLVSEGLLHYNVDPVRGIDGKVVKHKEYFLKAQP